MLINMLFIIIFIIVIIVTFVFSLKHLCLKISLEIEMNCK